MWKIEKLDDTSVIEDMCSGGGLFRGQVNSDY